MSWPIHYPDYNRKEQLENRLEEIAEIFAMAVGGTDLRFGSAFDRLDGSAVASCSQRGDGAVCLAILFSRKAIV